MLPLLAFGKVVVVELLAKGSIRAIGGVLNWLRPSGPLYDTDKREKQKESIRPLEDPEETHVMTQ